ncbi:bifunctional phosphopantothenoylcysteine decarboxylase/phosphopantothenate--cysteine ligase CoaBC [Nesterenkonia flava]|uniref:Coenzyme A biosynthesis bifunctional protein CoaBC n=1 Tax=Nesterenkonia flava TaxID=469799 RepID=A0ABU1FPP3_9MICC|nr:bifunctional phosphopantothenoylcysteine decarboxylase/phosphopantothenate--cysteine ligase CoaBC [Nesterenkonia flava]MDR5710619.1 bifunctional phosphopantothenoylcysteine decarboxylase/phosphopantothenate--cysteine ligase CoaBC [Nesterenkonia flava]
MRIVLGVSAGIAAYKAVHLLRLLREDGHQVDVIPTPASLEFVGKATWEAISGRPVTTGVFEGVEDVRHVRLGQEAELVVVAPATADLLARTRAGQAGDLLTTTLLATEAPVVLVPAMHTEMWNNPATAENVRVLRERGIDVMEPAVGRLTGADTGPGRLPEPADIYQHLRMRMTQIQEPSTGVLAGRRVVITAGGTREPLDPVRYLGNRSSGKQGIALAQEAAAQGAHVHLIAGIVEAELPRGTARLQVERIETAQELQEAVQRAAPEADLLVMAAAVADFRPAEYAQAKIKKTDNGGAPVITLTRNPDILAETVHRRSVEGIGPRVIVGFAAETGDEGSDPLTLAQQKLQRKGCDLLVLNRVGENLVFGEDATEVHILASESARAQLKDSEVISVRGTKAQAAEAVLLQAAELL